MTCRKHIQIKKSNIYSKIAPTLNQSPGYVTYDILVGVSPFSPSSPFRSWRTGASEDIFWIDARGVAWNIIAVGIPRGHPFETAAPVLKGWKLRETRRAFTVFFFGPFQTYCFVATDTDYEVYCWRGVSLSGVKVHIGSLQLFVTNQVSYSYFIILLEMERLYRIFQIYGYCNIKLTVGTELF